VHCELAFILEAGCSLENAQLCHCERLPNGEVQGDMTQGKAPATLMRKYNFSYLISTYLARDTPACLCRIEAET